MKETLARIRGSRKGWSWSDPGGALRPSRWPELIGSCGQREVGKVVRRHPAPELPEGTTWGRAVAPRSHQTTWRSLASRDLVAKPATCQVLRGTHMCYL